MLITVVAVAFLFLFTVAVAGVVLLRSGGGGDVELTQSQAEAALLTEGDVGSGFTVTPPGSDGDPFRPEDVVGDEEACADFLRELSGSDGRGPLTERTLQRNDGATSTEVSHSIENVDDDTTSLSETRRLVESCPEFDYETAGQSARFAIETVEDPAEPGSDRLSMSVRVTFTAPNNVEVRMLVTTWQRSGVRSTVTLSGPLSLTTFQSEAPDATRMGELLEKADEKLKDAVDEAR